MRLLKFDGENNISLTSDLARGKIPPYAILSHTWGDEEVSFNDITKRNYEKAGFTKIQFCGRQAKKDGLEYVWIDTCCIDKRSSSELSEAINSMFYWYRDAVKCYVYLTDVSAKGHSSLLYSRWFSRGWTLGELLAPATVEFFSREGEQLGSKATLLQQIEQITSIPRLALQGEPLSLFTIHERLQWTEGRSTTREEDQAYSLLGIFDCFMALIYGEGDRAMERLLLEIKSSGGKDYASKYMLLPRIPLPPLAEHSRLLSELEIIVRKAVTSKGLREQCRVAVSGPRGVGKTEFCLTFAKHLQSLFWGIFWVDARTENTIETSFVAIGKELTLDNSHRKGAVSQTIATKSLKTGSWVDALHYIDSFEFPWLLIFGQANNASIDYERYFPLARHGVILLDCEADDVQRWAADGTIVLKGPVDEESEHEDTLSDISQVSSAVPSLMSDWSINSLPADIISQAADNVVDLLLKDSSLSKLYSIAVSKFPPGRFQKNHDQLLKQLFKDLREEVQSADQLATVRLLRHKERRLDVTNHIRLVFAEQTSVNAFSVVENSKRPVVSRLTRRTIGPYHNDVGSDDENANSDSSDDDDDGRRKISRSDIEQLKEFLVSGLAFQRFKKSFYFLLYPPANLHQALESLDVQVVKRYLAKDFATAVNGSFEWLKELAEIGYTYQEMAQLLLEERSESPWIDCDDFQDYPVAVMQIDHHIHHCAHGSSSEVTKCAQLLRQTDVQRTVQALCGLGGVSPRLKDVGVPLNSVKFDVELSACAITLNTSSNNTQDRARLELVGYLSAILANFCTAVAVMQNTGLCCDSFTVLMRSLERDYLELRRIQVSVAQEMLSLLHQYCDYGANWDRQEAALGFARLERNVLEVLGPLTPDYPQIPLTEYNPDKTLHECALAVQFLCIGFVAYTQAHIGPIDPFFLDTSMSKISLRGTGYQLSPFSITGELVKLTCLAEMTQQDVLAFRTQAVLPQSTEGCSHRLNVRGSISDFVDTWGPAYYIYNGLDTTLLKAVALGSGFLYCSDQSPKSHHWSKHLPSNMADRHSLDMYEQMNVGALVEVNLTCSVDEVLSRQLCYSILQPIGSHQAFWQLQQRQAGISAGQYVTGNFIQVWNKNPGVTLKDNLLLRDDCQLIYDLEQTWGLQVSLCTNIARRVPLRQLLADLLPAFLDPLKKDTWQDLMSKHDAISALLNDNLFQWLGTMTENLQTYVLTIIRKILTQLKDTGFDNTNSMHPVLVLAWPCEGDVERGLRLPCRGKTYWAQILADAEDCATFAYMTPKCLETSLVKCCGDQRVWENSSRLLITEVSPSYTESSAAANLGQSSSIHTNIVSSGLLAGSTWKLDQDAYHVQKMGTLLLVKVERMPGSVDNVAHLVVSESIMPPERWKRFFAFEKKRARCRLRERQAAGDHSEGVLVRSVAIC